MHAQIKVAFQEAILIVIDSSELVDEAGSYNLYTTSTVTPIAHYCSHLYTKNELELCTMIVGSCSLFVLSHATGDLNVPL